MSMEDHVATTIPTETDETTRVTKIGIVLFYASWNAVPTSRWKALVSRLEQSAIANLGGLTDCTSFGHLVQVDQSEQSLELYVGETDDTTDSSSSGGSSSSRIASGVFSSHVPSDLPVIAIDVTVITTNEHDEQIKSMRHHHFVANISSVDILHCLKRNNTATTITDTTDTTYDTNLFFVSKLLRPVQRKVEELELQYGIESSNSDDEAIRIFIAGDRSSVGKSSICLGIIGSLLASGKYTPDALAYIKPATQSESTQQLIQLYCDKYGIHCVPIGPLVYYRGFTRAFLAGDAGSTTDWLHRCSTAVDRIARGKRVVIIDGVGFPAVGSICGTSNATMASACGYPLTIVDEKNQLVQVQQQRRPMGVVLVGGSGVGAAVDAFNMNATYFETVGVPVMGGIFNKLSKDGFYSLDNCKEQVTAYFDQSVEQMEKGRRPFGFVPLFPSIVGKYAMDYVDEFIEVFRAQVDVDAIIDASQRVKDESLVLRVANDDSVEQQAQKRHKLSVSLVASSSRPSTTATTAIRSRQAIETEAISAGAAPSA